MYWKIFFTTLNKHWSTIKWKIYKFHQFVMFWIHNTTIYFIYFIFSWINIGHYHKLLQLMISVGSKYLPHLISLVWKSLLLQYYINNGSSTLICQINENTDTLILTKGSLQSIIPFTYPGRFNWYNKLTNRTHYVLAFQLKCYHWIM